MTTKQDILDWYCSERCYRSKCREPQCEDWRKLDALITEMVDSVPKAFTCIEEDGTRSVSNFVLTSRIESWKREVLTEKQEGK